PNGGNFIGSVAVSMTTPTSGASIYYTTDGSAPTTSSTLYAGSFNLMRSGTIRAKAFKSGYNPSAEASASFASDLVAYWKFDEGNGTTISDASGNGNTGTLVNGPQWTNGVSGKALYFDGIASNVAVLNSTSLDLPNSFTFSAWVNPAVAQSNFTAAISKNSSSDHVYFLYATSGGSYCGGTGFPLAGANIAGSQDIVCSASGVPLNTWSHLTSTYDGSTLRFYVNGSLSQSVTASGTIESGTGTFQIGASQWGEYFNGLIDEVRIYNRALSDTEIQAIYQQTAVNIPFGYSVWNSGNQSVNAGSSASNTIGATLLSGASQSVSFSVSGLPSGATASFSSASCTLSCSTVLTISTSGSTPAGNYQITVTSSGGGVKQSTVFTLSVTLALTVATPTITPNGGAFSSSVSVALQSST